MLLKPDCIPCVLRMALGALTKLALEPAEMKSLYREILKISALRGERWDLTSPEVIEQVMLIIKTYTGKPDPFSEEKVHLNRTVLTMEPFFKDHIRHADNPVGMAVILAILGNAIDMMLPESTTDIETDLKNRLAVDLDAKALAQFLDRLDTVRRLLYFTDNAGEIILDNLLIQTLVRYYGMSVTVVVRHESTLNDVTLHDVRNVGFGQEVTLMTNGISGPLPGTVLKRCSPAVRDAVEAADLIIAKGGGNFDTLGEQLGELNTDVSFLLLSKCTPYNRFFNVPFMQPVVYNVLH
ncbi:MAG: DUF89 family protein [Desulfobacteraceae bacterium]|nr:DUF89 family protein [Desulfobacteraceae bacterium]